MNSYNNNKIIYNVDVYRYNKTYGNIKTLLLIINNTFYLY